MLISKSHAPCVKASSVIARHEMGLTIVAALASCLLAMDFTSVSLAMPALARALKTEPVTLQWVITAPQLLNGSLLILGGRLADLHGPRRCFLFASLLYLVGGAIALLSPGILGIILGRAINGASLAMSGPALLLILSTTLTPGKPLNRALGVYGAFATIGAATGVIAGGIFLTQFGPRGAFALNLLVGAANLLAGCLFLPSEADRIAGKRHLDISGAILTSLTCGLLILAITSARRSGIGAPATLTCTLAAGLSLVGLLRVEATAKTPLVPLSLLKINPFVRAVLALGFGSAASVGIYVALGGYLQNIAHYTPQQVGLLFLPKAVAAIAAGYAVPEVLRKIGRRAGIVAGYGSAAAAFVLMMALPYGWVLLLTIAALTLFSCGAVLGLTAAFGEVSHAVAPSERGVASALMLTSMSIFAGFGGAFYGVVLQPLNPGAAPNFEGSFMLAALFDAFAVCAVVDFRKTQEKLPPDFDLS